MGSSHACRSTHRELPPFNEAAWGEQPAGPQAAGGGSPAGGEGAVSELVCSQAGEAEFGILDHPANRRALRHEQHPTEGNALLLPPCRDPQEISVLRQQDAAKGRRSRGLHSRGGRFARTFLPGAHFCCQSG